MAREFNHVRGEEESWAARASGDIAPRSWRVVIAEDEALPAELLKRTLLRLGHRVVGSAQNGVEAIELTRALQPDVVIMDLRMPVMDGWTAMAELTREMLAPIVVVSALEDREAVEHAIFAGASGYLTKPVRADDLERALELAIARFADVSHGVREELRRLRAGLEECTRAQSDQRRRIEELTRALDEVQTLLAGAARRAAVTSLAHGLAHEINNALTPIITHAQLVERTHARDAESAGRARQIVHHAQRIAGWTATFRQVTMGERHEPMPFSFNGVASEAFAVYEERLERMGIVLGLDLDDTLPAMTGHPNQIQEALMMLTQNAVEAQEGGGTIGFRTRHQRDVSQVLATLSDSGSGIVAEHLGRVFEPGFSTKQEGRSARLGWGLYAAKQIVNAHRGTIEVASPAENATRGTTVHLKLPVNGAGA